MNYINTPQAFQWIREIITKKIANQQALISMMVPSSNIEKLQKEKSIARLQEYIDKINALQAECVSEVASQLRGWEGVSSKIYFEKINTFVPEPYKFNSRSQNQPWTYSMHY